jgi:hypothetical protein
MTTGIGSSPSLLCGISLRISFRAGYLEVNALKMQYGVARKKVFVADGRIRGRIWDFIGMSVWTVLAVLDWDLVGWELGRRFNTDRHFGLVQFSCLCLYRCWSDACIR